MRGEHWGRVVFAEEPWRESCLASYIKFLLFKFEESSSLPMMPSGGHVLALSGGGGALVHEPLSKTFSGSLFSPLAFHYREVGRLRRQWNRADVI